MNFLSVRFIRSSWVDTQFIAVHMRRADFGESCKGQTNCFVPLTAFVKQIIETKKEAQARFGYRIDRVLLFSGTSSRQRDDLLSV